MSWVVLSASIIALAWLIRADLNRPVSEAEMVEVSEEIGRW